MTWFKVDDAFHSHPKVLACDPAAIGLWVVAGSWSSAQLTGGVIPADILPRLFPEGPRLAEQLVAAGLWKTHPRGFRFHDWKKYNPTATEAKKLRAVRAAAGRKGGLASGNARSKIEANASRVLEAKSNPVPVPDTPVVEVAASTARGRTPQLPKHNFEGFKSSGVVATRQPPPFAEANRRALHPDTQPNTHERA